MRQPSSTGPSRHSSWIWRARSSLRRTGRAHTKGNTPGSRDIPAAVRRVVWVRDFGRCAFVGPTGHRCTERGFVEFHHVRPYEVGGEPTVENIQLRCGRHNRYEAKVYFNRDERYAEGVEREVGSPCGAVSRPVQVNSF